MTFSVDIYRCRYIQGSRSQSSFIPCPSCEGHGILGSGIGHTPCMESSRLFTDSSPSWWESVETAHRWCAKLNLGPSKQIYIEEFPKNRVSLQYTKKYVRIPVPNIRTSSKGLQFAETSPGSCEVSSKTSTHRPREACITE